MDWKRWVRREPLEPAQSWAGVDEEDMILGEPGAPITLVEYGDYECPTCRRVFPLIQELLLLFPRDLRFVFRHFPQPKHARAFRAAEAAVAAHGQGQFWPMHERLFRHQHALDDRALLAHAQMLGLEGAPFAAALAQGSGQSRVERDLTSGRANGVTRTPTFFINGLQYVGEVEYEPLRITLDALRRG